MRALLWRSAASYSVYLFHIPVTRLVMIAFLLSANLPNTLGLIIAGTLGLASAV
ncbi:hypothetical protein [Novosphingobium sp. SG707]|uniref:hypothetical protein n=1 Tax=Novosphingobium sp. SG707 TaxID=2586996 RepID=UPI00144848D2|nr:hypothetical protein [Novosphingobium sp. SG707]NKJ02919.1 peptidoglycan/LPS O-acetylase OafA/YrhL [Novosphingobium sp. SG707]